MWPSFVSFDFSNTSDLQCWAVFTNKWKTDNTDMAKQFTGKGA